MMPLKRPHYFLLALLATFFNPLVLNWYGTSSIFIVVVPITLLVWVAVKWDTFIRLEAKSSRIELIIGTLLLAGNLARNALVLPFLSTQPIFGVFDMLIALVGLVVAFFGLRALRQNFLLPTVYLAVLVVSYQLEYLLPEIQVLQNFLADVMVRTLNFLGIRASIWTFNSDIVTVWGRQGIPGPNPFSLWIENQCTGVKGMFAYGSLALLMILDVPASRRRKLAITLIGLAGTFLVNIARLLAIFLSAYQWGVDAGLTVHSQLGYGLFIGWIVIYWTFALKYVSPSRAAQTGLPS